MIVRSRKDKTLNGVVTLYTGMCSCICGGKRPAVFVVYDWSLFGMEKKQWRQVIRSRRREAIKRIEALATESPRCDHEQDTGEETKIRGTEIHQGG